MRYADNVEGMSELPGYAGKPPGTGYDSAVATHARKAYRQCQKCGIKGRVGENLSQRGLCADCGIGHAARAAAEMAKKRGPAWDRWQAAMLDHARRLSDAGVVGTTGPPA